MAIGGVLHVAEMVFIATYAFILPKHKMVDYMFVFVISVGVLSWLLMKNECFISYAIRKMNDPEYEMGSDALNMNDLTEVIGLDWIHYFVNGVLFFMFISFFIAARRSQLLPNYLSTLFIACSVLYLTSVHLFTATHDNQMMMHYWKLYDTVFRILFTIIIIVCIYTASRSYFS